MYVIKIEANAQGKFVETVVARDLPLLIAKARAKTLNDSRDTGNEDVDETSVVSYIAREL